MPDVGGVQWLGAPHNGRYRHEARRDCNGTGRRRKPPPKAELCLGRHPCAGAID